MRFKDKSLVFLAGIGLGAAVMYFLDPGMGARRRAVAGDRLAHQARDLAGKARHRLDEVMAGDDVLVKRVRTALGRVISNSRQITVTAEKGEVTLTGIVSEEDANALGPVVSGVRGVKNLVDRTQVEEEAIG